ncbi:MAG: phytanoyl-CoA dioxygenase family protein [Bacteroidota bacterium]|nr:phytanoyl-CoA dioxygenase family protein [Bacteroidota bacterium]
MISENYSITPSTETGALGIYHLKRFWSRSRASRSGAVASDAFIDEWPLDVALMDALGLGIEQTLQYLFRESPTLEEFEKWALERNGGTIPANRIEQFNALLTGRKLHADSSGAERLLSPADHEFWNENGYLIIPNAVSLEDCIAAEQAIWDFLEMDRNDSSTWYTAHPARQGIMVQFFQHPALQANRDSPKIRKAFEELWGTAELQCNTDRVSFNPPENERYRFPGPSLHWDVSLELPIPLGLQGILYLTDTAANQGALTVVPGFQNRIENWIHNLPEGVNPRDEDLESLGATPITGKAGDFIIWHQALPHGSRPNTAARPRITQYICWQPFTREIQRKWK